MRKLTTICTPSSSFECRYYVHLATRSADTDFLLLCIEVFALVILYVLHLERAVNVL